MMKDMLYHNFPVVVALAAVAVLVMACASPATPAPASAPPTAKASPTEVPSPVPTAVPTEVPTVAPTATPNAAPAASAEQPASELATAGMETFASTCAGCHGTEGEGARAPALIGPNAGLAKYGNAQQLYDFVHTRMPARNPGSLSDQQTLELVAHLLLEDGIIQPDTALSIDSLGTIALP